MNRFCFFCLCFLAYFVVQKGDGFVKKKEEPRVVTLVKLPEPQIKSVCSLEESIKNRCSIREYANKPLSLANVSQLLWAAQGITHNSMLRASPSAGALYPLEVYVCIGNVTGLEKGKYHYNVQKHALEKISGDDKRADLSIAALGQPCIKQAPFVFILCGVFLRSQKKYGGRAQQYVYMEVGCVSENIYLQSTSLGLGTVFVGAFDDENVQKVLGLKSEQQPLCIVPVGFRK